MRSNFKLRRPFDPIIPVVGIVLSIIGLVMILSASQITAADDYGNPYHFFTRQLVAWGIGLVLFFYFFRVSLDTLYKNHWRLFAASLIMLALVLIPGIGGQVNGARRWINFHFLLFQPAEVVKFFLIIFFAAWLSVKGAMIRSFNQGIVPFIILLGAVVGLVMLEPDLDTSLVIIVAAMTALFVARAHLLHYLALVGVGLVLIVFLIRAAPYRAERLAVFLGKEQTSQDTLNSGYHKHQALLAIGSGGVWGKGFGQGTSKYAYLPESHTDSIFAVIAEELGFVRASLVIVAFLVLAWRGFLIAFQANSTFVQYLAVGLTISILFQALVNIGGMMGLLPLAGLTLPFVSYGGTSLIVSLGMLGLLTNISRETTR
jgi:cell division protein FtsW